MKIESQIDNSLKPLPRTVDVSPSTLGVEQVVLLVGWHEGIDYCCAISRRRNFARCLGYARTTIYIFSLKPFTSNRWYLSVDLADLAVDQVIVLGLGRRGAACAAARTGTEGTFGGLDFCRCKCGLGGGPTDSWCGLSVSRGVRVATVRRADLPFGSWSSSSLSACSLSLERCLFSIPEEQTLIPSLRKLIW